MIRPRGWALGRVARTGLHSPVISSRLPRPPEVTTAAGAATINLFGLAAIAAVAFIVAGLLTATIGHPAGIAGYLKLA